MHPGKIYQRRRIPTGPTNRKFASTTVTGRSFAAKRAIARRVAKQMPKKNDKGENMYDANGNLIVTECCNIPTATISKPVQKYRIVSNTSSTSNNTSSTSSNIVSTITGTWTANSPVDILLNIQYSGAITSDLVTLTINWNGEFSETKTISSTGIHLLSYDFPISGDKNISISYLLGNGIEDKVKVGFKYGANEMKHQKLKIY